MNLEIFNKKSNVSSVEQNTLDGIESYHERKRQLVKEIETKKLKGEDVSLLEDSLNDLENQYKEMTETLNSLDSEN